MGALTDFFQSASNAVASNVSAPVDGISWLMRKAGFDPGPAPVGGSDWMRNAGLTADVSHGAASVLGETAGMLTPFAAAAKAPQIARTLLQGADNLAVPAAMNKQAGAVVWHGSPHKFDAFDASKIGTGEGAQAYGHGIYTAQSPDVARSYLRVDQGRPGVTPDFPMLDGVKLGYDINPENAAASFVWHENGVENATKAIADRVKNLSQYGDLEKPKIENYQKALDLLKDPSFVARTNPGRGNLYKVDLPDEHIAKMLDWDKPLSQQHPDVQAALSMIDRDIWHPTGDDYDAAELGQSIYQRLANQGRDAAITAGRNAQTTLGASQAKAAEDLRAFGIPGIRYLDQGSRATGGTSNYVVFPGNEGALTILERNGQAPAK